MIQYQFPGATAPLGRLRVQWLASFALATYPAGFVLFELGEAGRAPDGVTMAGCVVMLAAFVAAMLVIPTGIQRIAAGVADGLDEFQLAARLKAQSLAYRWFSGWVFVMVAYANIASRYGWTISTAGSAFSAIVFWVLTYSTVMPAWFLARALPAAVEDD